MEFSSMIAVPSLSQIALLELNETDSIRSEALVELRSRIQNLPLEQQLLDVSDYNLIRIIRGRKYYMEKAFHTAISLQKFGVAHPTVCGEEFTRTEMEPFFDFLNVLPYPSKDGHIVVVLPLMKAIRLFTSDFLQRYPHAFLRSNVFFLQQLSHHPFAQVAGVIAIIDFSELTMWDSLKLSTVVTLPNIFTVLHYIQHCIGLRLKQVYCFHAPSYITWLWSAIQVCLSESMRKRFFFNSDYTILQDSLLQDGNIRRYLPKKYGGEGMVEIDGQTYCWIADQFDAVGKLKKEVALPPGLLS